MSTAGCNILNHFQTLTLLPVLKSALIITAGFFIAHFLSHSSKKIISKYASSQQLMVIQKIIYFPTLIIFIIAGLQELGFKLSVILGSAGIATAAVAIASQTSLSNIVSGLFLIIEKSFKIGDRIKVGSTSGTVISIDLLSVKILTANNTLVRLPNDTLIKSEIVNITRFESRRLDLTIKVSHEEDLTQIKALLLEAAKHDPHSLHTPYPTISIKEVEGTDVYLELSVWVNQKNYDVLRDSLNEEIAKIFRHTHTDL